MHTLSTDSHSTTHSPELAPSHGATENTSTHVPYRVILSHNWITAFRFLPYCYARWSYDISVIGFQFFHFHPPFSSRFHVAHIFDPMRFSASLRKIISHPCRDAISTDSFADVNRDTNSFRLISCGEYSPFGTVVLFRRGQTMDALEKGILIGKTGERERKRIFALMKEIMDSNADEV